MAVALKSFAFFSIILSTATATSTEANLNVTKTSTTVVHASKNGTNTTEANATLNEIDEIDDEGWEFENKTVVDSRRILYGKRVSPGKRPYMVYLQLTKESAKAHKYRGWLCGGVIVDVYHVLTSAACVEDADRFYIVSGTTKFVDSFDYKSDYCVCKQRRRVIWKCIPKNYKFDFQDSIKWSSNDIAIVRVEKPFKFGITEKGCEFATDLVCYNNVSRDLEKAGTKGFIAGWGSGSNFREGVYRRQDVHIPENAKFLQEAKVCVMDNEQCAKKWAAKFRNIITQYMICTKDVMKRLSDVCNKKYANCTDVGIERRLGELDEDDTSSLHIDLGRHLRDPDDYTARRSLKQGGFCENDHGGPLVVKYQNKERVIGVISACKIDPKSHSCHGPFLYTSVFKNRQFLSCAINKDVEENCRRVFRTGITHEEWSVSWDGVDEDDDDKAGSEEDKEMLRINPTENSKNSSKPTENTEAKKEDKAEKKDDAEDTAHANKETKTGSTHKKEKTSKRKRSKKTKLKSRDEVFYESSRDDNVNEPNEN